MRCKRCTIDSVRGRYLELWPAYWSRTRARLDPDELAIPVGNITVPPTPREIYLHPTGEPITSSCVATHRVMKRVHTNPGRFLRFLSS